MRTFFIILFFLLCSISYSQDTTKIKMQFYKEIPTMVPTMMSNYSNHFYYRSLNGYKIIIPLDFKLNKKYFYYKDRNKTYKIY